VPLAGRLQRRLDPSFALLSAKSATAASVARIADDPEPRPAFFFFFFRPDEYDAPPGRTDSTT